MIFNSFEFAVFLPLVLGIYWMLKLRAQNIFLVVASYIFYGFWDWRFLSLILLSTIVDFYVARRISGTEDAGQRKFWVTVSIVTNLGILGLFKYCNFFIESAVDLLQMAGFTSNIDLLNIVLPVGISFYTFQTLSYTIDVYRKDNVPTNNFIDFALYVSFFPQLVAGPIERSTSLMPQISRPRQFQWETLGSGASLIVIGLFKKVFVADNLAPHVDALFAISNPDFFQVVAAGWLFAFQIYADFSGYSDIARGTSRCLGIELRLNFNFPYRSTNPQEFWKRWHISLSSWLGDYLYIPLGGNRGGTKKTYANLSITMLLGGLWHGAAWNYVLWGAYQGFILCVHRYFVGAKKTVAQTSLFIHAIKVALFFQVVCYGWILFRAESFGQIVDMTAGLFRLQPFDAAIFEPLLIFALPLIVVERLYTWLCDKQPIQGAQVLAHATVMSVATYYICAHGQVSDSFIYFQF